MSSDNDNRSDDTSGTVLDAVPAPDATNGGPADAPANMVMMFDPLEMSMAQLAAWSITTQGADAGVYLFQGCLRVLLSMQPPQGEEFTPRMQAKLGAVRAAERTYRDALNAAFAGPAPDAPNGADAAAPEPV